MNSSPSRTTNLCNEISNFQQRFDEYFHEAWDRYKDLLRACPHYGVTELHQLDTFYNALNPADQDSLNAAAGGNLLERCTQDVLTIIENKSKIAKLTHAVNQQTSVVTTAMTAILKQFQANPSPASVKAVEEICVTYGGAHPYYQCMANQIRPPGFAQPNVQNNQNRFGQPQGFNRGNNFNPEQSYQAPTQQNQNGPFNELKKVKRMNEANMKAMETQINMVKNELRNEIKNSIQASLSNQTNEIKNIMASLFQMKSASTSGSGSPPSNTVANLKGELKAITTQSGIVLDGPTIPTPPPFINPEEDERVEETLTDPDLVEYTIKVPPPPVQKYKPPSQREYVKMLKALLSNKEKLQELANTPLNENFSAIILKKLPEKLKDLGKFLIPCGFSELKCKALADLGASINLMPLSVWKKQVPLILGRPFLRTARALIDVHDEEMILRDGDERLTLNMRHDTSSYSNQPQKASVNLINIFNVSSEDFLKDLFSNQPSGNLTFSSHPELTSPEVKNDIFDSKGSNVLSEKLLDLDIPLFILMDLIDQSNLADSADNFIDSVTEMFTDKHALDYSSPSIFDKYDDDFLEVESDAENVYNDPFDSKGEKIKEVDALPSANNEDKVFNSGILIQEKPFEIITHVVQDKKLVTSNASLMLKDFDPPFYESLFFKEVPRMKNDSVKLEVKAKQGLFGNPKRSHVQFVSFSPKGKATGFDPETSPLTARTLNTGTSRAIC
nr:hypothetical protein [Tanacetum cinerariifolium]